MKNYLDFEKEIKALEQEVDGLKSPFGSEGISEVDTNKIKNTQKEINKKLEEIYSSLNSWQKTQVARHEDRPKANFYIKKIFSQFTLLSGDRYFGDDKSVIAGFAEFEEQDSVQEYITPFHPSVLAYNLSVAQVLLTDKLNSGSFKDLPAVTKGHCPLEFDTDR